MKAAADYRRYLETLSRASLSDLGRFVTPDVHFVDPFNDVHGCDALRRIFEDMFTHVSNVEFRVDHLSLDGTTALMAWRFSGSLRRRPFTLTGMSTLRFAPDGRVCEHIDYWDSATQFYMRLPVIGWLLSIVRRRVASQ